MPSSTPLAARVRALAMVLAMALAAAPSHAGDDIRAGPTRTAKERLGGKASDEQCVDNCKVPPDLRGPKPRPERCGDDWAPSWPTTAVPTSRSIDVCWYWSNSIKSLGYWDFCQ